MNGCVDECRDVAQVGKYQRVNLSLNLENPLHKTAWEILSAIPRGHRVSAVCRAVTAQGQQDAMIHQIREVMREELKYVSISAETKQEPQDDDAAILGFLRTLQEGDDP